MKELLYPKTYATVTHRSGTQFQALTDNGELLTLNVSWRNGHGHHQDIQEGLRIKIYKRPNVHHLEFRFLGS